MSNASASSVSEGITTVKVRFDFTHPQKGRISFTHTFNGVNADDLSEQIHKYVEEKISQGYVLRSSEVV